MERTDSPGMASATLRSTWIWVLLLGVGLATVFLNPPAELVELARQAAPRLLRGDVTLTAAELTATTLYASLILFKPLLVIGAILLLEFRFAPGMGGGNRRVAWLINGAFAMFLFGMWALMRGFDLRPEPLFRIDPGEGPIPAWLLAILVLLVTLFVFDFLEYWIHRAQHRFGFLWRFHAVHHSVDVDVRSGA